MERVHLITEGQVRTARESLQLVVELIEMHTTDDISDPHYAHARARALEILSDLAEGWQRLPTARTIDQPCHDKATDSSRPGC